VQWILSTCFEWIVYRIKYKGRVTKKYPVHSICDKDVYIDIYGRNAKIEEQVKFSIKKNEKDVHVYELGCNDVKKNDERLIFKIDECNHVIERIVDNNAPYMERKVINIPNHDHCTMNQFLLLVRYGTKIVVISFGLIYYAIHAFGTDKVYEILVTFGVLSAAISYLLKDTIGNTYYGFKVWFYGNVRIGDIIETIRLPPSKLISMDFAKMYFMSVQYDGDLFTDLRTLGVTVNRDNHKKHNKYFTEVIELPYKDLGNKIIHRVPLLSYV